MDVDYTRALFQKPERRFYFIVAQGSDGPMYYTGDISEDHRRPWAAIEESLNANCIKTKHLEIATGEWTYEKVRARRFETLPKEICGGAALLINVRCSTKDYSLAYPYFRPGEEQPCDAFAFGVPYNSREY